MSEDYYKTLIKGIIENNDKEEAIKIIANKLNEKQISNEKEMLTNLDKDKEIERLNNIINELEKYINKTKLEEFEKEYGRRYGKTFTQAEVIICNMILNRLQELKENK